MRVGWSFLGLVALVFFTGCPLPVPRKAVVQPPIIFTIVDEHGKPVANNTLYITWGSHPHERLHQTTRYHSDQRGHVVLKKKVRSEWIMPLMMHGIPQYFWIYCAIRPGYQTVKRRLYHKKGDPVKRITIRLKKGTNRVTCPMAKAQKKKPSPTSSPTSSR